MRTIAGLLALSLLLISGCASPDGDTAAEQKAYALSVRDEALSELYERDPDAQAKLESSPGYIFVSGFAFHPGILTFANAYGIVQDNTTGAQKHIRLTRFAIGPGLAVKGYYGVALLKTAEALKAFDEGSWYGGGFAEASLKFGDFGGTAAAEGTSGPDGESYLWTHTGVALELAVGGGTVSPDEDLK